MNKMCGWNRPLPTVPRQVQPLFLHFPFLGSQRMLTGIIVRHQQAHKATINDFRHGQLHFTTVRRQWNPLIPTIVWRSNIPGIKGMTKPTHIQIATLPKPTAIVPTSCKQSIKKHEKTGENNCRILVSFASPHAHFPVYVQSAGCWLRSRNLLAYAEE